VKPTTATGAPIRKYHRVRTALAEEITAGRIRPSERLPSVRELAGRFGVTVVTIMRAIEALESDGLVKRVHGRGNYATGVDGRLPPAPVSVLMSMRGHFYAGLFAAVLDELQFGGHDVRPVNVPEGKAAASSRGKLLERACEGKVGALVVDGASTFPFARLERACRSLGTLTFVFRCETTRRFPEANRVTADFAAVGRAAARRLVADGGRRLVFLGFRDPRSPGRDGFGPSYAYQRAVLGGFREEAADAGATLTLLRDRQRTTARDLDRALARDADGVFCVGDFRAVRVYQACARRGLAVGRDVRVIGMFDTPWCSALQPTLTSVSLGEARMAREVALSIRERHRSRSVKIQPRVVDRGSTAGG